jgi:hypothetical protein
MAWMMVCRMSPILASGRSRRSQLQTVHSKLAANSSQTDVCPCRGVTVKVTRVQLSLEGAVRFTGMARGEWKLELEMVRTTASISNDEVQIFTEFEVCLGILPDANGFCARRHHRVV